LSSKQVYQSSDYSQHLYQEIAESYDYASLEDALLGSVAKDIGAETSTLLHFRRDCDGYHIGHNLAQGVGNKVHQSYVSKFHHSDPIIINRNTSLVQNPLSDAHTDVYRLSDVCEQNSFTNSEYYNDFLKPSGIRHVLALAIKPKTMNNDLLVVIGFHRSASTRNFGDNALRTAVKIAPIIGSTIARLTYKENLEKHQLLTENLKSVLEKTGYLILDEALQIQAMSSCVENRVYGELPFIMQEVSQAVTTLQKSGQTNISIVAVCPDLDRTAITRIINFYISRTIAKCGSVRIIARIGFSHTNNAVAKCAQEFGWTSREAELVMTLAQGLANTEISGALGISVRTVENHLRSIYDKAGVSSRTQLLRQLLTDSSRRNVAKTRKEYPC